MSNKRSIRKSKEFHPAAGIDGEQFSQIKESMQQEIDNNRRILRQQIARKPPVHNI